MNCLVIGGLGFIGSHVADELAYRHGDNNVFIHDLPKTYAMRQWRYRYTFGDVEEFVHAADVVLNFAGILGTEHTFSCIQKTIDTNIKFAVEVMQHCLDARKPLVNVGMTGEHWLSPYSITKLAEARFAKMYYNMGLQVVTVKPTSVYGPRQKATYTEKLVPVVIHHCMHGLPIRIYGDGEQTTDFIYVEDVACAIADLVDGYVFDGREVEMGSGERLSVLEFVQTVQDLMGTDLPLEFKQKRKGEGQPVPVQDPIPALQLAEGLPRTIYWYKTNTEWIDPEWHSEFGIE